MRYKTGQLIKERREILNLSQLDLSKPLGFRSPQFISNLERGISVLPAGHVKPLARLLQVPTSILVSAAVMDLRLQYESRVRRYSREARA